jgi:hypothetical protein
MLICKVCTIGLLITPTVFVGTQNKQEIRTPIEIWVHEKARKSVFTRNKIFIICRNVTRKECNSLYFSEGKNSIVRRIFPIPFYDEIASLDVTDDITRNK